MIPHMFLMLHLHPIYADNIVILVPSVLPCHTVFSNGSVDTGIEVTGYETTVLLDFYNTSFYDPAESHSTTFFVDEFETAIEQHNINVSINGEEYKTSIVALSYTSDVFMLSPSTSVEMISVQTDIFTESPVTTGVEDLCVCS